MIFVHPAWLAVGLVACLGALWIWRRYDERQRQALAGFVAPHLSLELTRSISTGRRRLKRGLFAAAVALLFVALAEPQAGFHWEEVKRRGNDIVFAVDTSRSMLTPDVKPDRLVRAKLAIDDFVGRLDGDAVGLVAFAGSAFLQCPLTLDYGAFHESLAALDTHIIARGGTDISSAIRAAQSALHERAGSDKILILVTDGEDLEGDALDTAKAAFKEDGLKIYTVGVGSANGDLIPLPADQGGGFLKDGDGHFVRSRLDEPALKALAQATGGSYAPLGADNQGLEVIYREALAPLAKHDLASRTEKVYIERFQWPLAASLACLLSSLLVGTRRRTGRSRATVSAAARSAGGGASSGAVTASAAVIALLGLVAARSSEASTATAASAYQHGDYSEAQRDYSAAAARDPAQPVLRFDAGTAAYKAGDFPVAVREFQASLDASKSGSAERLAQQQDAYYNLGNTLYREGQKTEKSDPRKTLETWTGAVKAYDAALQLRADDADSKFNRDLVNRKLDQLRKQQQSHPQQGQNQDKNQQDKNQQDKNQQDKNQQDSSSGSPKHSTNGSQANQPPQSAQSRPPDNGQPQQGQGQSQQQQSQPHEGQGQPQQQQSQPQQGQGQPQQQQSQPHEGQGREAQSPTGQSQQQPEQARQDQQGESQQPRQGSVTPAAGNPPPTAQNRDGGQNGEAQRIPGQMSPEEARELLDSVKDEERRAPTAPSAGNSEARALPQEPSKDW
jgi:Ca-activated chloride channel family protein